MNNFDKVLKELGKSASEMPTPSVDVRLQVFRSLSAESQEAVVENKQERALTIFAASASLAAASFAISFFPTLQAMLDPWSYFLPS